MLESFKWVNWVDIIAIILLVRICYVSSYVGVGKQILPIFLLIVMLPLTLHNYREIARFFIERYNFPASLCVFSSYAIMILVLSVAYRNILRLTGLLLPTFNIEAGGIEKVGGIGLGLLRSLIIIGMLMIGLILAPFKLVETSVKNSYSGSFFIKANVRIYTSIGNLILRKKQIYYDDVLSEIVASKNRYLFKPVDIQKKSKFYKKNGY